MLILLERRKSHQFKVLEAVNRRLPETDKDFEYYNRQYYKMKKGYKGELRVDRAWKEIVKSNEYCILHSLELKNIVGNTHQMDSLFLCPHFMLVVEIKNISGRLDIDSKKHQLTQTLEDGNVYGYGNPIDQAKRHVRYLYSFNFPLPIEYVVIISDPTTIIGMVPRNEPIFHLSGLHDYIQFLNKKHEKTYISMEKVIQFGSSLKSLHSPRKWDFEISTERLRKGIYCEKCNYKFEMAYYRGSWQCKKCFYESSDVLFSGLNDYYLLVGDTITNKQFRDFFKIDSKDVATRLLAKLPDEGKQRKRVYSIPHNILE